jgi:DNA helicase HerA-like ATPase
MEEVGKVLEDATPLGFSLKAKMDTPIGLHDYVVVNVDETIGKEVKQVQVLAEVIRFKTKNPLAKPEIVVEGESDLYSYKILEAEILGYIDDTGRVIRPKTAPNPGAPVYRADSKTLQSFFKGDEEEIPVYVGHLIRDPDVKVPIYLQEAQFHIGVFAATRAGKSYLAGKIMEEILEKAALPVIVVDIHGDYVKMDQLDGGGKQPLSRLNPTKLIFKPPKAFPKLREIFSFFIFYSLGI